MATFAAFKLVTISISLSQALEMKDQMIMIGLQTGMLILKIIKKETSTSFLCHPLLFFSPLDALPDFRLGIVNSSLVQHTVC